MAPFIVLVLVTLGLAALGGVGVPNLSHWSLVLRGGLAAMFLFTGVAHFDAFGMRGELVEMVPPWLPAPGMMVTVSGVLELVGAFGLLWARSAPWAAAGLSGMLVAMFPANVYKALEDQSLTFSQELLPRTLLQLLFLVVALAIVWDGIRGRRLDDQGAGRRATSNGQLARSPGIR